MAIATQIYNGVTAITLTLASLAAGAARQSTAVINTTNKYLDAIISGNFTTGAAISTGNCYFLLYGSDATSLAFPATGTDGTITIPPLATCSLEWLASGALGQYPKIPGTDLIFFTKLATIGVAAGSAFGYQNLSVSQAFNLSGLGLPPQWGLVFINQSGQGLSATASVTNYNGITQNIA